MLKKGDIVRHINGGRGEVMAIEPGDAGKTFARVAVLDTTFPVTRRISVEHLRHEPSDDETIRLLSALSLANEVV